VLKHGYYYLSFIKHYLSATLIDVLHSPFVFGLYNQCIKRKSTQPLPENITSHSFPYFRKRADEVLLKYVLQYQPKKIYLSGHAIQSDFADALHNLNISFDKTLPFHDCDMIYFERVPDVAKIQSCLSHLNNDSVIMIRSMYDSKRHTDTWNAIKKMPEITVTIDLFFAGMIFIRKEQRKQDFKLRLF
jgi:hypothetical protein